MIDISQHWRELTALVAVVVWLSRLEAKAKANCRGLEKLSKTVVDGNGEVRFTSKDKCQDCRAECKQGFHEIHIRIFEAIEKANEKGDKRAEKQEEYQRKVAETLADVRSFMRTTSALMPGLLKSAGYNIFNNSGMPKDDD